MDCTSDARLQARPGSWRELLSSDEHGGSVFPMMVLAHEDDPDPAMRPPPIFEDRREEIRGKAWRALPS